jgi:hypothetical protein
MMRPAPVIIRTSEGKNYGLLVVIRTFVAQHPRIYPTVPRNIGMTHTRGNHLYKELIFERRTRQKILPLPGVLVRGDYSLARNRVRG